MLPYPGLQRFPERAIRLALSAGFLPSPHPPELLDTLFQAHEEILSLADSIVEDDGRGLPDPTQWALPQSGLGMTRMRARARMLGGELEVLQRQPRGLRLRVEIPQTVPGEG